MGGHDLTAARDGALHHGGGRPRQIGARLAGSSCGWGCRGSDACGACVRCAQASDRRWGVVGWGGIGPCAGAAELCREACGHNTGGHTVDTPNSHRPQHSKPCTVHTQSSCRPPCGRPSPQTSSRAPRRHRSSASSGGCWSSSPRHCRRSRPGSRSARPCWRRRRTARRWCCRRCAPRASRASSPASAPASSRACVSLPLLSVAARC